MILLVFLISALARLSNGFLYYPEQLRVAWTEREDELRVTWVTYSGTESMVKYRAILCNLPSTETFIEGTYKIFNEGSPNVPRFQFIHTAVIPNVTSDCHYEYSVGNSMVFSPKHVVSGLTPDYQRPFNWEKPVTFILIGDLGADENARPTIDLLVQHAVVRNFDAVVHIGDIAYELEDNWGEIGDMYFRLLEPLVSSYPYMTLPGNHEKHMNYTHYKERFLMPDNGANQGTGYFYSYNIGRAHIVMMNTEVYLSSDMIDQAINQNNWLIEDLRQANLNRAERPWLIVMSHHPLYCSIDYLETPLNEDCFTFANILKHALEDIFYEASVDVYFQAHVHYYERNSAIYKNETVPCDYEDQHTCVGAKAPIYITSGCAGNYKGHNDLISETPQLWSRSASNSFGYGKFVIHNETHFYWEEYSADQKEIIDTFWIVKSRPNY